ncbi:MAG: ABC transporter substrate-binding protein [Rhodospirillaceae bacterium]|nr:ABC transporter substrate-binding protein [Rhodospirillaceae bacterium]
MRASTVMLGALILAFGLAADAGPASAQDDTADTLQVPIVYLGEQVAEPLPLSLVEPVPTDKGLAGARLGIEDNATTGKFLKHDYTLVERILPGGADLTAVAAELSTAGQTLIVADLAADRLLALADLPDMANAVILNIRAQDDALRASDCRANVFHVIPSRAMKADALGQFLVSRQWMRWVLIHGINPPDQAFAEAIRRTAKRYRAEIVEERAYGFQAGSRRSDTGEQQVREQMIKLTQRLPDYDVLVAADESEVFGEYLPYRTWDPRPVVGTQGLVPTSWHRSQEQWGGTQLQRRFTRAFNRWMLERDYAAWEAVRSIGEAVTRTNSADSVTLRNYIVSDAFELAAFKGKPLSFRKWDQQLRQPILLASPLMLVSVSPQEGFLHQRTPLDSLGYDEPDSTCRLNP